MSRPPLGSTLDLFGFSIPWYSLLIVLAVVIGIALAMSEEKRRKLPKDTVINFALLAIPFALVGARLYYVAFTWHRFAANPIEILYIWNGGLAIYGAVLGAMLAAYLVTRHGKVSFWTLLDTCIPSLVLGQAIGRWGNYANMEAYGARIYNEAAQFFPLAVEIRLVAANGAEFWYWHMATFFYESAWCFLVFILLWANRKKMQRSGDITFWYILLYCAERTVVEGLRDDSLLINISGAQVRVSQVLSALACVAVLVIFFLRLRRAKKLRLGDFIAWGLAAVGIACAFIGEFERNAYQMLFIPAQITLGVLFALDIIFLIHYLRLAKRMTLFASGLLLCGMFCAVMLALGIGRLGGDNTAFIAIRQVAGMAHVLLSGAWFYLRASKPKPPQPIAYMQTETTQEDITNATA